MRYRTNRSLPFLLGDGDRFRFHVNSVGRVFSASIWSDQVHRCIPSNTISHSLLSSSPFQLHIHRDKLHRHCVGAHIGSLPKFDEMTAFRSTLSYRSFSTGLRLLNAGQPNATTKRLPKLTLYTGGPECSLCEVSLVVYQSDSHNVILNFAFRLPRS